MKKIIPFLAATLIFTSCASLPSDPSKPSKPSQTEDKSTERQTDEGEIHRGNGDCPKILQMGFSNSFTSIEPVSKIRKSSKNDPVFLYFELKDTNWDIKGLSVKAEAPGCETESVKIDMDYQYQEQFFFVQPLTPADPGTWTFTARAEDHAGNQSAIRRCTIEVE